MLIRSTQVWNAVDTQTIIYQFQQHKAPVKSRFPSLRRPQLDTGRPIRPWRQARMASPK